MTPNIETLIKNAAGNKDLPVELVRAIVLTESSGEPDLWKVEPPYRYLWDNAANKPYRMLTNAEIASERAPSDFTPIGHQSRDTEWWGQQASWGLMQVMGAVTREHGFKGPFPALCDPVKGLLMGCTHLADLASHYKVRYGWAGVVAAYNAGSPRKGDDGRWVNQSYVDTVRAHGADQLLGGA